MNTSGEVVRRVAAVVGGVAIAVAALAACQSAPQREQKDSAPTTTLNPLGPNSYAPTVTAPGPKTALPGNVKTG